VLLAPYSAVLSPATRQALGIQLAGCVLVVDEAHNLVRFAGLPSCEGGRESRGGTNEAGVESLQPPGQGWAGRLSLIALGKPAQARPFRRVLSSWT
jgi:hypothetical protein